jgi:site-specific DNA recombinase
MTLPPARHACSAASRPSTRSAELTGKTLTDNLRRVADAEYRAALAAHDTTGEVDRLGRTIADADAKISWNRDTLDAGGDPALIAGWITEATSSE